MVSPVRARVPPLVFVFVSWQRMGRPLRTGLASILITISAFLLAACGPNSEVREVQGATDEPAVEPVVETVEVTREVTVERTVVSRPDEPDKGVDKSTVEGTEESTGGTTSGTTGESIGGSTRGELPVPDVPSETDIKRTVGDTATLDNGNSVTVFSGQSGVPAEDSVYNARAGMDFFVIEAEVCVPGSAGEPSYFTPREFNLLNDDIVRRMASVPTKLPALRGSSVDPGECNRGYITFQVEDGEEPRAVIYEGSSVVEWELEEG